jgi:cyclophilin family peptidyl-prolyl cis-trans isomerase/protein-disulfide isomerase
MVINPATSQGPALTAQFGDRGHIAGPEDAPVTIVVFGDYQCTGCAYLAGILEQIRAAHPADVREIYLQFPLTVHNKAVAALQAAEAADLQGKFWEMHNLLFEKQTEWSGLAPAEFPAWAEAQASGLGLEAARFRTDFHGAVVAQRVQEAIQATSAIQQALPLLFLNSSTPYSGRVDLSGLDQVVSLLALTRRQFNACPPMIIDPLKQYIATLHTGRGDIVLQLYADKAPLAVNNFVFLARGHWYDGITFHRVVPGLLAQSGDPSGTGLGNPGYYFANETGPGLRFDRPGLLAMANTGAGTNGSQFFITEAADPQLNGGYTIFGQVISGMEVLAAFTARDPHPGQVVPPGEVLISAVISER